jgi:hypothetical protein
VIRRVELPMIEERCWNSPVWMPLSRLLCHNTNIVGNTETDLRDPCRGVSHVVPILFLSPDRRYHCTGYEPQGCQ